METEKKEIPQDTELQAMQKRIDEMVANAFSAQAKKEEETRKPKVSAPKDLDKATAFRNHIRGLRNKDRNMVEEAYHALGGEDYARAYQSEGTDADGGYSVPPIYHTEILQQAQDKSILFQECNVMRTTSKTDNFNYLNASASVAFVDEANDIASSKMTQGQFSISQKKVAAIGMFTNESLNDAPLLRSKVVDNIKDKLEEIYNQILFTLNTPFDSILSTNLTSSDLTEQTCGTTVAGTSIANLTDVVNAISAANERNAKFYGSRSVRSALSTVAVNTTGDQLQFLGMRGGILRELMGFPFVTVEEMPSASSVTSGSGFAVFGDLKATCHVVVNTDVRMQVLTEGTIDGVSLAQKDMTAVRLITRLGFKVFVPKKPNGNKIGLVRLKLS